MVSTVGASVRSLTTPQDVPSDSPGDGILCRILEGVLAPAVKQDLDFSPG